MATIDLSRSSTEFRKHFTSVRAQMGRVFTDDDHNDNERLHGEDARRARVHIIGPAGSPDDGFRITEPTVANGRINFEITPGTFYLGGHRLDLEQPEQFQAQADWVNMSPADVPEIRPTESRFDLVYLECWQQPVAAVEDSELFEVALGGPDTSVRMRVMRRVHVLHGQTGDCHQDWANLTAQWATAGLGTLDAQHELVVNTQMQVGFEPGSAQNDLCSPPVAGGYLGAENQAIRVQLVSARPGTDVTHFTWGFDNAAPLYRITVGTDSNGQRRKVTMCTEPKDKAHWPIAGQVVELLPWSAVLPNQEKVAEVSGFLARVDTSYDPDTQELFLTDSVPTGFGEDWLTRPDAPALQPEFFYMRVWNRGSDTTSPATILFVSGTPVPLGNSGLNVTFSGTDYHPGDYWIIAVRPESPNRVVPWLLEAGRTPHGIRRYYAPLAVIAWTPGGDTATGQVMHDCRETFPPLTRLRTCCTYTVGDGTHSFGAFTSIQDAIDALPDAGGEICLLPGIYQQHFQILNRRDVRVHGCGAQTIVQDNGQATGAVITIQDSQRIAIHNLAIEAPTVIGLQLTSSLAAEQQGNGLQGIDLDDLKITARDQSALVCRGGRFIRLRRNDIEAQPLVVPLTNQSNTGKSPLVFLRADDVLIECNRIVAVSERRLLMASGGLHLGGGSERVDVRCNHISGGNGNGITLGSITFTGQPSAHISVSISDLVFFPTFGLTIDVSGCLHPDPDPEEPRDPHGIFLLPSSDGDLYDVCILDNDILEMGLSGIATLRYFKQGVHPIVVRNLDIAENRIRRCLQLDLGNTLSGPGGATIGFGGVSLITAEVFTFRHNVIEWNGQNFIDPVCGVFVGHVRGLCVESNRIADNGPYITTNKQPTAGPRGGLIVQLARTPLADLSLTTQPTVPREGFPAARITGNTIIAPLGRALALQAYGLVSIEGNAFTSHGINSADGLQGVTVTVVNLGIAYELSGLFSGFTNLGKNQPTGGSSSNVISVMGRMIGGKVLFNDNQILLAPQGGGNDAIASSILLLTADDVLLGGNQAECRLAAQTLDTHGFIFGWSARVTDNRFEERLQAPGVSAFTLAALNCTTDNQGTRCFIVVGIPALAVRTSNLSLIDHFSQNFCQHLSAAVKAAVQNRGLDA